MFQTAFKYYKAKTPPPSFGEVIPIGSNHPKLESVPLPHADAKSFTGLLPPSEWKVYELSGHPGLLVVLNPFTPTAQRYWMVRCLADYPSHPNTTNQIGARQLIEDVGCSWWELLQTIRSPVEQRKFAKSLRWVTLGYQYDWTRKVYDEARREAFPSDLGTMVRYVAAVLGYDRFSPEAAIVNYYPIGATLAGHTDHSEDDQTAPLFSFSFGQPAVFLIGGTSREERPDAILLRSGDIVVMSGASRLCYHAVPRVCTDVELPAVLGTSAARWQGEDAALPRDDVLWSDVEQYIQYSRININVRQVLKANQQTLQRSGCASAS
uniref:Fe2OG dioxygenase domain-containing protein n=1 Tax=Anopheles epiroticus TaxID=199890 RepID=A0A182PI01_9DIPT